MNSADDIYNDALELPPTERVPFVRAACQGDQTLYDKVMSLLAVAEQNPSILAAPGARRPRKVGSYEIIRVLGRGAMGEVYLAVNREVDRREALKFLPDAVATDAERLRRFTDEARLLGSLNHPGIATLYRFDREHQFLAMEYVEGDTLANLLKKGPLPSSRAIDLCAQIADAIGSAHATRVLHRDLKPANVMVTPSGRTKVLDLGIGKSLQIVEGRGSVPGDKWQPLEQPPIGMTSTTMVGTPGYMSPEQMGEGRVDERTDVWAFGCLLYECLTGRQAFRMDLVNGRFELIDERDPRLLRSVAGRRVRNLLDAALQRDAAKRPRNFALIRRALERERTWTRWQAPLRWARRAGLAVLVATVLFVGYQAFVPDEPLPDLRVEILDSRRIKATSSSGTEWTREMSGLPMANGRHTLPDKRQDPHVLLRLGRSRFGVVVPTLPDSRRGLLSLLDTETGRTMWEQPAGWITPLNTAEAAYPYFYWQYTESFAVERGNGRLITGLKNGFWYQTAVQLWNRDGKVASTYYHPGHVSLFAEVDSDGDRQPSLALFGDNSSARLLREIVPFDTKHHCGFVALLDTDDIAGQAFPYSDIEGAERDWPDVARAKERAYLLIPPIHPDFDCAVTQVELSPQPDGTEHFAIVTFDNRIYHLDHDLRPFGCWLPLGGVADSLARAGVATWSPLQFIASGERKAMRIFPEESR